jgi:nucleoside diphosphate kinase
MAEEMEYTLAMIKPDAVAAGKASEIQQLAEMHGFLIIAKRQLQVQAFAHLIVTIAWIDCSG